VVNRLLSSKHEELVLNEEKSSHVRDLLRHSEEHIAKMDFDTIFLQAALAVRLNYSPTVSAAKSGALVKSKALAKSKRKRKTVTLHVSESQPKENVQPEAPILSSGKSSSEANTERIELSQEETSEQTVEPDAPASSKR
jgi:hypothetical protein